MILDKIYSQNAVIGATMQASILRNDVINNNIANAEVPGYKKKVVEFESLLTEALASAKKTGKLELGDIIPQIRTQHRNYDYRYDEGNVDIETEMVELYQNSVKYDGMVTSLNNNSRRLNLVLTGR